MLTRIFSPPPSVPRQFAVSSFSVSVPISRRGLAAAEPDASPTPVPADAAGPLLADLLKQHAAGLKEQWAVWSLGQHLPEWLLLATQPAEGGGGLFGGQRTPGLWRAFIPVIFLIPTDNTPCEQRVSVYRHQVSQNQDESTVEAQWKFICRLQKQRAALQCLRSASKYNGRKAKERAEAGHKLSGHARSKLQLLELWRDQLALALTYTMKEVRALQVAKLVRAVRKGRREVPDADQALEVP